MNSKDITQLFQDKLGLEATSITDKSKGVDQEVKIIETNNGTFVLKIPHEEKDKILKQIVATKLCAKKGMPVPKIIFSNDDLLIETCIEGIDLDELDVSKYVFEKIYFEIGKLMKKMHSIKGENFGPVNQDKLV